VAVRPVHDGRQARERDAIQRQPLATPAVDVDPDLVEDGRRRVRQVRIAGHHRPPTRRLLARDHPDVRAPVCRRGGQVRGVDVGERLAGCLADVRRQRGGRPGRLTVLLRRLGGLAGEDRGRVRERLAAHHVLEEQLPSVEAGRGARCLVGDQPLRVRDVVGLEREAERQQLRDRQRVERRPRGHVGLRQLERGVLGGERVRREPGVHAVRVGLEGRAALSRDRGHRAHSRPAHAERPQLNVARERARAEQLSERAVRLAAARIHLEQPVLRVQVNSTCRHAAS
jgi:hypothetical protein